MSTRIPVTALRFGLVWALQCLFAASLVLGTGLAAAQSPAPAEPHNIVQLSGTGSVETPQDWLTVTLSTSREGSDAGAVQAWLRQSLDTALMELKKTAQPGGMEVRSGGFSLQPRYSNDAKINGWIGSAELVLEGSDFARIGTAAAKAQPLTISSMRFSLSRQARAKLETQAQSLAIADFKTRAADIARSFGFADFSLREVSVGTVDQSPGPMPRMVAMSAKSMSADAAVPMEGGKTLVVVTVSGSVQLK
ncbi:SIMPL domain-containing protein [Rhodoferax lacus]|uniref:SIMPL domain-containing protein n=1 Tax=Rhodoferax lacus TaxID=2184758 RepID=A0A3E1RJD3_9BURK|nr:SIMPL domain-containing protein [Rhodoferax lacus]RFO98690.1 SIMPL domain-containing protein [Rhodoferax lacus]